MSEFTGTRHRGAGYAEGPELQLVPDTHHVAGAGGLFAWVARVVDESGEATVGAGSGFTVEEALTNLAMALVDRVGELESELTELRHEAAIASLP